MPPSREATATSDGPRGIHTDVKADFAALDQWIASAGKRHLLLADTLRPEHLADLYITLPTRDGSRPHSVFAPPQEGAPLGFGHHLVFFHPRSPEKGLRSDGTDVTFSPPEPFTRRMWAGGRMVWKRPLRVGDKAIATSTVAAVEKKGFETGTPMVFVKQKLVYRRIGGSSASETAPTPESDSDDGVCMEEERTHVYLAPSSNVRKNAKEVKGLPRPDFTFEYFPSPTTLFRFSALTFNGHYIHLDKEYAQNSEGYPERLVHGPLTALMLLDTTALNIPGATFKEFEYRAINPIVVNRPVRICGTREDKHTVRVWAEETETNVVGMTGKIILNDV